ncbi:SDR family NAD(P)-dependent oxidoreductase [Aurantiacibacter rhizosphaerae]|nr:SDR family oxidoreductase [Aurantiacibacter rhizosphaerae]
MAQRADVAIVTGAGGGLGGAIAARLIASGLHVVATDLSQDALDGFRAAHAPDTDRCTTAILDVTQKTAFARVLEEACDTLGSVEVLVNCAAVTKTTPLFDISPEEFSAVMDINLRSVFLGSQVFGDYMRSQGYGRIINIASLAAQNGGTATGGHYAASKGGIVTLTKVFARELAKDGVTVNAIAPGPLDVPLLSEILPEGARDKMPDMIPVGHLGDPAFIGKLAVMLASREASSMTGATLDANGGLYVR